MKQAAAGEVPGPRAPTLPSATHRDTTTHLRPTLGWPESGQWTGPRRPSLAFPGGRGGCSTAIGTPNLQMKRLRFRAGQGQSRSLSQSPAPMRSTRFVPLTGPSQLKAAWDPPPAAGSPGSPGPRGSCSLVRTAAAPLDTACQGWGGKD